MRDSVLLVDTRIETAASEAEAAAKYLEHEKYRDEVAVIDLSALPDGTLKRFQRSTIASAVSGEST